MPCLGNLSVVGAALVSADVGMGAQDLAALASDVAWLAGQGTVGPITPAGDEVVIVGELAELRVRFG